MDRMLHRLEAADGPGAGRSGMLPGSMKKLTRVAGAALGLVAILLAVLFLVGEFLPAEHTARVDRTLSAPPERVWAVVRDFESGPEWRSGLESVTTRALSEDGDPRTVWVEAHDMGELAYVVEEEAPEERLVTRIVDNPTFGGTWTTTLAGTDAGGTHVTIVEQGVVRSRIARVFARFVFGYETTARTYLDDLERRCAE